MDDKDFARIMGLIKYTKDAPCLLCEGKPNAVMLWMPLNYVRKQLGQPEGKDRLIAYTLCKPCQLIPDALQLAEGKIQQEWGADNELQVNA